MTMVRTHCHGEMLETACRSAMSSCLDGIAETIPECPWVANERISMALFIEYVHEKKTITNHDAHLAPYRGSA